ncbi:unnamed protein product [Caenorhabditis angaria]|uniref:Nematode cuticle collagen N-terminal domain-containing protein n=1 Tax=Caenorhabditis angaria TaxID=860376 RepID=A0A9P1N1Y1_9PELO|nr:unnamed protein product [Caenorhabditis angaria]
MNTSISNFLYKFRFLSDFLAIGGLCFCLIMTIVTLRISIDIVDEINEVRDVFMRKSEEFKMYADDASYLIENGQHHQKYSEMFGILIKS